MKRALSKQGPQTEFAWLVEEGVRAYQRAQRKPTLEGAETELSGSLGIGIRTLQAWRHTEQPTDCNLVLAFVKLCVEASPSLGQRWVTDLLRAADMAPYAGAAIREVFGASGVQPDTLAMLADQIIEADAVFQRVRVDEFVGREWLTARLDAFLNDPARRYGVFLLVGEAGVGKTSFLAHLVRERGYLYLFAEQAPGEANLGLALRSLAAQIATRYRIETCAGRDALLPDNRWLDRLLRQAAGKLGADEKIVIVCDGLDEAGAVPGGNVLGLPSVLPDGVYLVLSQRPSPVRLNFRFAPHMVRLEAQQNDNLRDMECYLVDLAHRPKIAGQLSRPGYTETDFVRTLADKSGGLWIYLHYVVSEMMEGDRSPLDLDRLPMGLVGYYAEYWGDWREGLNGCGEGPARWDTVYAPLLATLAAAQEPITAEQSLAWSGITATQHEVERLLKEKWRAFITESRDSEPRFSFYHASLRDFVGDHVDRTGLSPASLYLMDDLSERTRQAHRQIVDCYGQQCTGDWPLLAEDQYARRHLAAHLSSASLHDLLFGLVAEGESRNRWAEARYSKENTYAGYLADLDLAWRWTESEEGWNVGRQARCALIQSSVYSLAENISPELLFRLVETRRWKPEVALAHIRQVSDERQQGAALKKIMRLLPPGLQTEALTVARAIADDGARAVALGGLSSELDHESKIGVMREALRAAQGAADEHEHARVLSELAKDLPVELQADAVQAARGLADEAARAIALAGLVEYLSPDLKAKVAVEALVALDQIDDGATCAVVLRNVGPHLPTAWRSKALAIGREIGDEEARARALTGLIRALPQRQRARVAREAWSAAQGIADESARAFVLADLAGHLPDDLKSEALAAAEGITHELVRLFALGELVKHLPAESKAQVVQQSLQVVREMEDEIARAMAFMLVGESLPDRLKPEALALARETADERARAFALSQLVEYLPDELRTEALAAAREIDNAWARATALSAMVDHVSDPLKAEVALEALDAARSISDEWARAIALRGLAGYLPEEIKSEAQREELVDRSDGFLAEAVLETLAATLRGRGVTGEGADECLAKARDCLDSGHMAEALAFAVHAEPVVGNWRAELLAEISSEWKAKGFPDLGDGQELWNQTLRALARHRRPELLNDMTALAPLMAEVGGVSALIETFRAIRDVARWWS